jgi:hypothetical protein
LQDLPKKIDERRYAYAKIRNWCINNCVGVFSI